MRSLVEHALQQESRQAAQQPQQQQGGRAGKGGAAAKAAAADAAHSKQAAAQRDVAAQVLCSLAEEHDGAGAAALKLLLDRAWDAGKEVWSAVWRPFWGWI